MKSTQPYQPLLFRILHGLTGLFLIAAILTAFWTYDTYDGRWGRIPLPSYKEIEGIHGSFGLYTLLIFPAFVMYAFHRGQKRLVQADSFAKLTQVGKPIWWYNLNRFANTFALVALTFALFSGKMMDSGWLPRGELNHSWYYAHLIAWIVMVVAIALHLLMNARVGGVPLLLSMLNWRFRDKDSPRLWSAHLAQWWSSFQQGSWSNWFQSASVLTVLELAILISIAAAWIIPLFK
ncbi:cytochrome b/b6 domain-containing protein [Gloeocapsopsis crepidinum LEGE 06123]|uniref:Cytochrome b/b6 domain-containing protein n=1 Tax=Gloeocapsopsis crepidinum LEGE 06123 TaxID=588587 RepID=A0ABR9UL20_9CHRO|nr:cytochrome b/b6 domain-containing protein [Gloeocapsopsis crepidinum]MBE9188981.1 cytochrome b/b6 domain-containing protein [Gloeocapsopsis crepidinum LEGE 06123]